MQLCGVNTCNCLTETGVVLPTDIPGLGTDECLRTNTQELNNQHEVDDNKEIFKEPPNASNTGLTPA